jgi:riboflavin-specific deaminase-like protein
MLLEGVNISTDCRRQEAAVFHFATLSRLTMAVLHAIALMLLTWYPYIAQGFIPWGHKNGKVKTMPLYRQQEANSKADEQLEIVDDSAMINGVTLKIAFDSQWGVADMSSEKSERFTCSESLDMVHRLRRCSDAVLVGRATVEKDNCTLTVRRVPLLRDEKQPVRIILDPDRTLRLENYQIFRDGLRTFIIHKHHEVEETSSTEFPDVTFIGLPPSGNGKRLSTRQICEVLAAKYDIHHVMVEGGPDTARSFLEEGMVDRAILVHAPLCFKEPLLSNLSASSFDEAGLRLLGEGTLGVDHVDYWSRPELPWPTQPPSKWP